MRYNREKKVQVLEKLLEEDFKDTMMSIHKMSEKDIEFVLDRLIERRLIIGTSTTYTATGEALQQDIDKEKEKHGITGANG